MWFIRSPWTQAAPARDVRHHHPPGLRLLVEGGDADGDAESTASSEHHCNFPVERPLHVEDGESASATSVHYEVAGSSSEGSSCDESDGDQAVERSAAGRGRARARGRRHGRGADGGGGLPAFVAAVGPAATVMLLALVALVAWKRRQRRRRGALGDDARGVPP